MKKLHTLLALVVAASMSITNALADQIGDKAKPLSIEEWVKNADEKHAVDVTDGKNIYVVEFWATWCGPCRSTIPHLTELNKKYKDKGVVFVGISNETAEKVGPFVREQGSKMDYIVARDKENATNKDYMRAYGQNGIPCAFIINKKGQVAWVGHPMSMEEPLLQILQDKYDLDAAIKADALRAQISTYESMLAKEDPKTKEFALDLLKKIGTTKESLVNLDKMLDAAYGGQDFEMVNKVLDQMAKVDEQSAKRAEDIRGQINSTRAIEKYLDTVSEDDADKDAVKVAEKELKEAVKGNAQRICSVAYAIVSQLGDKAPIKFVMELLDEADKVEGEKPMPSPDFFRALTYYKIGDVEKGDTFAAKAMDAIKDENIKKNLQAYLDRAKPVEKEEKAEDEDEE
ncbi:MAG: TlpA family protein disulfide reductase [Verrucomicrobia bacterium]|nr:TlpA family protein disulfide reductase [Verrucomicrobiota bacterium]